MCNSVFNEQYFYDKTNISNLIKFIDEINIEIFSIIFEE